jgi:hypothetical protein
LRSECAQNYQEAYFLRRTGFRIAEKAPKSHRKIVPPCERWQAPCGPKVTAYSSAAAAIARRTRRSMSLKRRNLVSGAAELIPQLGLRALQSLSL